LRTQFSVCLRTLFEEKGVSEEAFYAETSKRGIEPEEAKAVYEGQEYGNMRHAAAAAWVLPPLSDAELRRMMDALFADSEEEETSFLGNPS
jgi:hypothetical protein